MNYPPSLPENVRERAFHASNGELGVCPEDASTFLAACRADGIEVIGWEFWIIDHSFANGFNGLVPAKGLWCGGIPLRNHDAPAVCGGSGDADEAERELAGIDLSTEVRPEWLPYVRVNFTLDA